MGASSSTSVSGSKQYDVFISFRGEDTRHNFVSHLLSALKDKSIRAYIDNEELHKGDEISTSLIRAIQNSYGSLVIFSKDYASSKWCLNELLQILECRKHGQFVVPVFYNIDPSHVRNQTATYGEAFAKHEKDSKNEDKLQLWKTALMEAANIAGWHSEPEINRDESELIQNIVKDILQIMNHIYQPSEPGFVGIDKYCKDIELLLQRSPLVGIWGVGGVGKTTIAKVVFHKLFSQYDSCYFFENVRGELHRNGPNYIYNKLLSELLKEKLHSSSPNTPTFEISMTRLSGKKVLIVLDDLNNLKQLEHLQQACKCLRGDSKVIITTRDKHALISLGLDPKMIYEVQGLDFEKSLQLFKINAFNENYPDIGYEEITKKLVDYTTGLPLALKVLGSSLLSLSKEEWESALAKLKKFPNKEIHEVLKLSYDDLDPTEKQIFLDIACFLKGEYLEDVISLLDSFEFFGRFGIRRLQDKALVTIGYDGVVYMHDLIQEMGWNIVRDEFINNPEKRSRLWESEEVYDILRNNKGCDAIEGIVLNMSQIKDLSLKADTFKKMDRLRFLKFYSYDKSCKIHLPKGIESFSDKLRYFHWDNFPLHCLPPTFCAEKLVELCIIDSHITKLWEGLQDVVNLKKIYLDGCDQLMELPDLSNASKLERLSVSDCTNLCYIHPSLLHQDTLVELFVDGCEKLTSLKSERHLKSLKDLCFERCSSLIEYSLSTENVDMLEFFATAIDEVPSCIGCCKNLKRVHFVDSPKKVPSNISKSTSITKFEILDGSEFDPSNLPVLFDALPCLKVLHLINCVMLFQLPDNISILSSLSELLLRRSNVDSLPTSIKHLSCLRYLDVSYCERLRSLPELPLSLKELQANNCSILETLIPSTELKDYGLCNCVKLDQQSLRGIESASHYRLWQPKSTIILWLGDTIPSRFIDQTPGHRIIMELPPHSHLLGFVFCYSRSSGPIDLACDCYLEDTDSGRKEFVGRSFVGRSHDRNGSFRIQGVWLCYDHIIAYYLNKMERGAYRKISFQISTLDSDRLDYIKEIGVEPIYASELELLEFRNKHTRICFELEADEQQLPLTKKLKTFPLELELDLNTGSSAYLETPEIEIDGSDLESQDEEETVLVDKKILREFAFQPLSTKSQTMNDENEAFDFFIESELGDELKRCRCELEGDEQQSSLAKKFKESTMQQIPLGLELELTTNSYTYLPIERIQVGGSDHEKQDKPEAICTEKGI